MSLLHPFRHRIPTKIEPQRNSLMSPTEIKSLKNSLMKGKLALKSFKKGRAIEGNNAGVTGLNVGGNRYSNLAGATDEIQKKRLLYQLSGNIIVQSILRTRDAQVMKFCHPARISNNNVGYVVKPRHPKADGKLTKQQQKDIKRIERFIYNTGAPDANRPSRDKFPQFVTKFIHNKFIYDQINVEKIYDPDNPKKLDHFNMVDAGTVVFDRTPVKEDDNRKFLQIIQPGQDRRRVIHFDEHHLSFVTYHSGALDRHGYGYSAIEAAMNELQFENDTESFNARFFRQGGTTRGILLIDTENDDQASAAALKNLRQQWQSTAQGLTGAWKIPVISAHDAKFVNMTQSSKDMEFERWLNYLINIICSVFQIQPDEINFPNRGGGATSKSASSSINEGSTERNKLKQSKDKGLLPLLTSIEQFINDHILSHYAPNYRFMFTLGDDRDEQRHEQIMQLKMQNGMTINEYRAEEGLPKLTEFNGLFSQLPGDPKTFVQMVQTLQASQQAANVQQQAQSDVSNSGNPNHQNSVLPSQQQQNQQQQDNQSNQPNNTDNNNTNNSPNQKANPNS